MVSLSHDLFVATTCGWKVYYPLALSGWKVYYPAAFSSAQTLSTVMFVDLSWDKIVLHVVRPWVEGVLTGDFQ